MESLKPDCACALQRKSPQNLPAGFGGTLSPVRFEGKTCGIAAIPAILSVMQPDFSAAQTVWRRGRDSILPIDTKEKAFSFNLRSLYDTLCYPSLTLKTVLRHITEMGRKRLNSPRKTL
jgi:hypothetical protein